MPYFSHCYKSFMLRFGSISLVIASCLISACATVETSYPDVYTHTENPMLEVEKGLSKAKDDGKTLALVLGAQWCHDSRGLAKKFTTDKMAKLLSDYYYVVYIDVGYYKDLRAITQRFGQAHYYATPTVMLIVPDNEKRINWQDHELWGNADSLSASDYIDYFKKYSDTKNYYPSMINDVSDAHLEIIRDFEKQQSERLQDAYEFLVPDMIKEDSGENTSAEFYKNWDEVRSFRTQLNLDIRRLYLDAKARPNQKLVLPSYQPFSWEG